MASTQEGIFCPFCCVTLKADDFGISNVQQKITAHCECVCHRSNVYSVSSREDLNSEKFSDIELNEITAVRLLEAMAPGNFKIVRDSSVNTSKKVPECILCKKSLSLMPCDLKTLATNHLNSEGRLEAKKQNKLL